MKTLKIIKLKFENNIKHHILTLKLQKCNYYIVY